MQISNLRLFTSNRLENLADELAEVIKSPLASPFNKEVIVVQSRGMERWISMELARRHGICANMEFPFPNTFVSEVVQKVLPDNPDQSLFDPKIMTWRIMGLLPDLMERPGFESLRTYLGTEAGGLKGFQLSERIADTFDQYLLFRPEMPLKWERGMEDHWQAVLWRELVKGHENMHRAALGKALMDLLADFSTHISGLPERVSVFGISTLPRFHLQVFASISRFSQVNLFLMNPCMEYWAHIYSDWEMKRAAERGRTQHLDPEDLHLEKGNSLLVSTGMLGRDFFDMINEFDCENISSFEPPDDISLLSCIQSDILKLRERGLGSEQKTHISDDDASVLVHSCHSPMREVEVLYDRLLEMFETDPDLRPKDILVMAPDIEAYAPYIQAVFDVPVDDPGRIPFSIADQSIKKEGEIFETFLSILDLKEGRFPAPQVMAVLESRAVQRRFGLSESDIPLIRKWVEETRIRWGIDARDRSLLGLPELSENTWKAGLDRLLLGYAMPGREESMFAGLLPYDHMEGGEAQVLGRFLEFSEQLFLSVKSLLQPRTLEEWSRVLRKLLETFFLADTDLENEERIIRRTLNELGEKEKRSGFNRKVDIHVITCHLAQHFSKEGFGFGFITGGVTFCAMLPMRSIPFKTICLMGMNGGAYPRQSKPLGFDLMARNPKKGDRSRRNDDRYLFLEAMLSARERLYISYVGQGIRDNAEIPPSVLVNELMDYIEQGFELRDNKIRDHILTRHRLQPFSPEYFRNDERLFSYSGEDFEAARCLVKPRKDPVPFISQGLSEPGREWKTVGVSDLCSFFTHPARFFLNRRLGIYLDDGAPLLQETEPFEVGALDRYVLAERLVERNIARDEIEGAFHLAKGAGLLPHGTVGECVYDKLNQDINGFVHKIRPYLQEAVLGPVEVDLDISGFHLSGRIDGIYPERLMRYRYAKVKAKDRLRTWIQHLVLNCLSPPGYPRNSMLAGLDKGWAAWEYTPVEDSVELLGKLLERYWEGLGRPIHFFPESSWQYGQLVLEKQMPKDEALQKARYTWAGDDYVRGESEDVYYQLCFGKTNPIDLEFQESAVAVFGPIFKSQRKFEK